MIGFHTLLLLHALWDQKILGYKQLQAVVLADRLLGGGDPYIQVHNQFERKLIRQNSNICLSVCLKLLMCRHYWLRETCWQWHVQGHISSS